MPRKTCSPASGRERSAAAPEIIDAALACLDQVSRWVDDFEAAGALPAQAGEDGRAMAERLRSFLPAEAGQRQPGSAGRTAAVRRPGCRNGPRA